LPSALQSYLMVRHIDRYGRMCGRRYGPTFTTRAFPWGTTVVVSSPDAIRTVFTGDPEVWRAGDGYELLRPLLGNRSVIVLDGKEHLRVRRSLLPPFHGEAIRRHEALIEEIVDREVARWPIGKPLPMMERMQAITLDVMLRTVLGADDPDRLAPLRTAIRRGVELSPLDLLMWVWPSLRHVPPWRRVLRDIERSRALVRTEIARRRADHRLGDRRDVLSMLVAAGDLDDGELLDQISTLLLAGHDTTTTALAWTLERLVRHPEALARAGADDRYLDAAIKETLRVRPVLPAVVRRLAARGSLDGYDLPAGTTIMASTRLVHLSPELFPEPNRFRPERFLEGRAVPYSWIPFGGGPRRCLGASFAAFHMRVVLRTVLTRVALGPDRPADEAPRSDHITLMPQRGARVVRWAA
jgi:cytochrome P450 family 135